MNSINDMNLFTEFNKIDTDRLATLNRKVKGEDENSSAIPIVSVNETPTLPINEAYRFKYIQGYVNDSDVHYHALNFNPGEQVLIAKSFDANSKTKKLKLEGFYEDGLWTITERSGSNSFKVTKNSDNSISKIIAKIRLKKYNKNQKN